MRTEEELSHKRVQAVYLSNLLKNVNDEISALENADPYTELKAAHAAGKRIAAKGIGLSPGHFRSNWFFWSGGSNFIADFEYKIVEDDEERTIFSTCFGEKITIKATKCALTGKITAEVVNERIGA